MTGSFQALHTNRLLLKPVTLDDVPSYAKYFVDYEVIRHLSASVPWPYPEDGVLDYFENVLLPEQGDGRWTWGLRLRDNPKEVIGCIDLWREGIPEHRGFWLGKLFWGQGLMTEAADAVTYFAFTELQFEKLVFSNAVGNKRSRRIKEKAGAQFKGLRPCRFVDPTLVEAENWVLEKEDWLKSSNDRSF